MYKIFMLAPALENYEEIVRYLALELKNPAAAMSLVKRMDEGLDRVARFPFSCPTCLTAHKMKHEYRKLLVNNFIVLYWVDEENRAVMVEQIVYARRDIDSLLDRE